jgi:hypothetical protein
MRRKSQWRRDRWLQQDLVIILLNLALTAINGIASKLCLTHMHVFSKLLGKIAKMFSFV